MSIQDLRDKFATLSYEDQKKVRRAYIRHRDYSVVNGAIRGGMSMEEALRRALWGEGFLQPPPQFSLQKEADEYDEAMRAGEIYDDLLQDKGH